MILPVLFTIVIPTYNYGHWLPRALDSALAQEGEDYEIIIVDDGSTDLTAEVAKAYCAAHDGKVRYVYQDNQGIAAARNKGALHAVGQYVTFLDADDKLLPQALNRFRAARERLGDIDFAFGGHLSISAEGVVKKHTAKPLSADPQENFTRFLRKRLGTIYAQAAIIRRALFEHIKYPEGVRHNEDIVVYAQLLATARCASFPEPVVAIYKHADSLRHQVEGVEETDLRAVDALFDPKILPAQLMGMRDEFLAKHYLMQFRVLYNAGDYTGAKKRYYLAIRSCPKYLFRLSSLRKYLRIVFR